MNPIAYLLFYLYCETAEIVSDSAAVEDCTKEKRLDYARLLVLEASTADDLPTAWKNNLSGLKKKEGKDKNIIKRRINYMMKEKRKGLLQRGLMVTVSALTVVAGAGTVLAYEAVPSSDLSVTESFDSNSDYGDFDDGERSDIYEADFSEGDSVFVDFDGNEFIVDDFSTRALCTHSMVNGYWKVHSSNKSGGCSVKVYTAQRCKKCGYLANAVYQYTVTYTKCPH